MGWYFAPIAGIAALKSSLGKTVFIAGLAI
jgi:hypothetical protein